MAPSELVFTSIAELAPRLAARDISPVEVTEMVLARIEQHDVQLRSFITVMADSARYAARAAEAAIQAGNYLGPLHGIPIAVKDLYATRGVRTTFGSPLFADCDPDVVSAVETALDVFRDLGATVVDITLPDMQAARAAGTVILFAEAAAYHAADLRQRPSAFSDEVRALIEMGGFYTAVQYVQAQRLRRQLTAETQRALATYEAIVMPTSPVPATPITPDLRGHSALRPRNTLPFDLISLPAISVPCGYTRAGLPVGLQIVGKAFDEMGVLRVARAYEQTTT
jgi:Asp-tRNA(Asn)/Glu-tRNA(Gln) amidotransferase A subunit family amidase